MFADDCIINRKIDGERALELDLYFNGGRTGGWNFISRNAKFSIYLRNETRSHAIHGQTLDGTSNIDCIAKNANKTRAFFQQKLRQCPRKTKALCYKILVRPITEYTGVIWGPFTEDNIRKLEMVQRRAACMVYADFRPTTYVAAPQWPIPQERRAQAKVSMVHRIVYNLVVNHLAPTISIRAHNMRFLVPFARTLVYQRSFFADTIRIWNSLPQSRVLPFHRQLQKGRADHQTSSDSYWMI